MYKIINRHIYEIASGENVTLCDIVADASTDLPDADDQALYKIAFGSFAYSIADKCFYCLNSSGTWTATIPDYKPTLTDLIERDITSINIPDTVTIIGNHAFYSCTALTNITISNSVISIGNSAFYGCTGLTSITIPNSVTSIAPSAFNSCTNLTTITINKAAGSITGAPWGAPNATVVWTG